MFGRACVNSVAEKKKNRGFDHSPKIINDLDESEGTVQVFLVRSGGLASARGWAQFFFRSCFAKFIL